MARIVSIKVPEDVSEGDVVRWVAEGLSRRFAKRLVLRYLESGVIWTWKKLLGNSRRRGMRYGKS